MDLPEAIALHRAGRTGEAARAYGEILRTAPAHPEALIHYGVLRLQQGDPGGAEALLRRALVAAPESVEAHANLAAALQVQGRYAEAAASFQEALVRRPDLTDAQFGLGAALQACGRDADALSAYRAILAREPAHPEANFSLAAVLVRTGHTEEAAQRLCDALEADPDFAEAHLAFGQLLARADRLHDAARHFRQALDVDPGYIEARLALGTALSQLHHEDEAVAAFQRVLVADADQADAHLGLGTLLDRKRRHAEAMDHYRAVLAKQPGHVDAMAGLATALKNTGQHAAALELAHQVLAKRPDSPAATGLLGAILAETGAIGAASSQFRRAVALAPDRPDYAYYLVELAKVMPDDEVLQALEAMLPRIATYSQQEQCSIYFALAKAYDDIGERDRGFSMLLRGNAIKRAQTDYKEAATLALLDRIAQVFTPELLAARAGLGQPSPVPVFVVGMPRSGTTLVEQVLASHPSVFGAGERTDLSRLLAGWQRFGPAPFPQAFWTVPASALRQLGSDYVAAMQGLGGDAERIVDKLPANFAFAGLIRLILPNAKIIHVSRDPVDTCLSCFSKLFAGEQPFSYELGELGRYHHAYHRLMAHWRTVLPAECMLDAVYEDIVADFENQARRIIAHCGLPWDPACLEFHKGSRPVHTASLVQVRQPIYRSSVGRWRPAAAYLQPLLDGLAGKATAGRAGPGAPPSG